MPNQNSGLRRLSLLIYSMSRMKLTLNSLKFRDWQKLKLNLRLI